MGSVRGSEVGTRGRGEGAAEAGGNWGSGEEEEDEKEEEEEGGAVGGFRGLHSRSTVWGLGLGSWLAY